MSDRAELLCRLPGADFCPPEAWLLGVATAPSPGAATARAKDTAAAVDEFASRYWSLTPSDRREQWDQLSSQPADLPTKAFLEHLKKGLDVGPVSAADPRAAELSAVARELFALRPRPRAVRRAAWLDTRDPQADWQAAVGALWATDNDAAELDPQLVAFLDAPSPPPVSVESWGGPSSGGFAASQRYVRADRSSRYADRDNMSAQAGGSWLPRLGLAGVAVLVLGLARVIFGCAGGSTSSYSPSYSPGYNAPQYKYEPPRYTPPTFQRFDPPKFERDLTKPEFSGIEISACERYEKTMSGGMPPRYPQWVAAGRPKAPPPRPYTPPPRP